MRNWFYQLLVQRTTNECYKGFLNHVPTGSRLLDVGIGNGLMIDTFHPLIRLKQLRITGIDIDADYLRHCRELIQKHGLEEVIDVCHAPAEQYTPPEPGCFDGVLFCMSFMVLNDPHVVLRRARDWLKPGGQLVFAQAMFKKRSRLVDWVKPKLKYLTMIDFGTAIYEKDFFTLLQEHGLSIRTDRVLKGEWFNSQCRLIAASFQDRAASPVAPAAGPGTPVAIQATSGAKRAARDGRRTTEIT
jgi:ubiquinone/menaquinone biosynthesis C-methylase UbiE